MLKVSVNILGWTVEPLGQHEPSCTDGTVGSTKILQSATAPPARVKIKVSDIIVSYLPGGPAEMVIVLDSERSQQAGPHSSSFDLTIPYHCWAAARPAMARRLPGERWSVEEAKQHIDCSLFFRRTVPPLSTRHRCVDLLDLLTETVTNQSLEYRTLAVYKSAISQGRLPAGQTKLGDLQIPSRNLKESFRGNPVKIFDYRTFSLFKTLPGCQEFNGSVLKIPGDNRDR